MVEVKAEYLSEALIMVTHMVCTDVLVSYTCNVWVRILCLVSQIAKQQQQLIQQQHKINLLQQQIQVSSSQDLQMLLEMLFYVHTACNILTYVFILRQKPMLELLRKLHLSCIVPAGEHALRDDPGFPPQHPVPPSYLWPADDLTLATNPLQAMWVNELANRFQLNPLLEWQQ